MLFVAFGFAFLFVLLAFATWRWVNRGMWKVINFSSVAHLLTEMKPVTIIRGVAVLATQVSSTGTVLTMVYSSCESFLRDRIFDVTEDFRRYPAGFTSLSVPTTLSASEIVDLTSDATDGRVTMSGDLVHVEVGDFKLRTKLMSSV